jgi:serine/threonine protein kinase
MLVPVYLDDLAATRSDLPMFYAPERFDRSGKLLQTSDPAADTWSLGMLLIYMLRVSLPLLKDGPLVCLLLNPALNLCVLCLDALIQLHCSSQLACMCTRDCPS